MKGLLTAMCAVLVIGINATADEPMKNVFSDIPYADGQMGRRQLVDTKPIQIMQVALKPGQQVPPHNANSNVHLLIVEGQVIVTLDGKDTAAAKGDIVPVAFKTPMSVRNASKENASFLILKTPNPSEFSHINVRKFTSKGA